MAKRKATANPAVPEEAVTSTQPTEDISQLEGKPPKKKRKSWGQKIEEYEVVIPPRKRAKTDKEKLQRKNERIVRNRKAAEKSRNAKKTAQAETERENQRLKRHIAKMEAMFGHVPMDPDDTPTEEADVAAGYLSPDATTVYSPRPLHSPALSVDNDPAINYQTPSSSIDDNPLYDGTFDEKSFMSDADIHEQFGSQNPGVSLSEAHYPAVIMCSPLCLALKETPQDFSSLMIFKILRVLLQLIFSTPTFSSKTPSPIHQISQTLDYSSHKTSQQAISQWIQAVFPSIHSLISLPSTPTRPAVFRLKLLSRLISCNPLMSQLLLAAIDRELHLVVCREDFADHADSRWTWSSLMAIKWSIRRLELEHKKLRRGSDGNRDRSRVYKMQVMNGVDIAGVLGHRHLWEAQRSHSSMELLQEA